jgi:hypothetical protein
MTDVVVIRAELPEAEAWDLAQFLKRTTFSDALNVTDSGNSADIREEQARRMIRGITKLQGALAEVGCAPR